MISNSKKEVIFMKAYGFFVLVALTKMVVKLLTGKRDLVPCAWCGQSLSKMGEFKRNEAQCGGCQSKGQWVRCGNKKKMGHAVYFWGWRLPPIESDSMVTLLTAQLADGESMWNVHAHLQYRPLSTTIWLRAWKEH